MQGYLFVNIFLLILLLFKYYIYSYNYSSIYTPLHKHFKAFPVSNINSETSFLYQLFKENSNLKVSWPYKLFSLYIFNFSLYFILFIYICIYIPSNQHLKAFPVSKIDSEISFLYQLFKENSNFIVKKSCKVIYLSAFYDVFVIYIYLCIYTPSNQHLKAFPVHNINSETSFLYQLFKEISNLIV